MNVHGSSNGNGIQGRPLDHDVHLQVDEKDGEALISPVGSSMAVVDKLGDLLRGEMSAVEAYDLVLSASHPQGMEHILRELRDNHDHRVSLLRDRIRRYGGAPPPSSGAWGVIAKTLQRGADCLGIRAAALMLEEGEKHGVRLYAAERVAPDLETSRWVHEVLFPEQQKTEHLCREIVRLTEDR